MDNINFTGAFLIKNPTPRVWRNIEKILPKRKIVFQQFGDEQDKFVIVKDCYDKQVADAIKKKRLNFKFYPEINLKSRLDPYFPKEAEEFVNAQTVCLEKSELKRYFKEPKNLFKVKKYKWKPNDHIEQTLNALDLKIENSKIEIKNGVTIIRDKNGKILAKASPNNQKGVNFVYVLSDNGTKKLAVSYTGATEPIYDIVKFQKKFLEALNTDKNRIRPKSYSADS